MNNRKFSKKLKKSDILNLNKLFEDENIILKKEISVLNSLLKSQEERYEAEIKSIIEENESLMYHNSELVKNTIELQNALKSIRNDLGNIHRKTTNYKEKSILHTSRVQETSRLYDKENLPLTDHQNTSRSSRNMSNKAKISPLRAGLIKDSKKISKLVTKIKQLKQTE